MEIRDILPPCLVNGCTASAQIVPMPKRGRPPKAQTSPGYVPPYPNRLLEWRLKRGNPTQDTVAERTSSFDSGNSYGHYERGEYKLDLTTLYELAQALRVNPVDLLHHSDRRKFLGEPLDDFYQERGKLPEHARPGLMEMVRWYVRANAPQTGDDPPA